MSRRWAGGSSRAQRRARAFVLDRDGHRCQLKLPGCTVIATQGHHTGPREIVGDDPAHMVAVCQHCNLKAGDPTKHDPAPRPRTQW